MNFPQHRLFQWRASSHSLYELKSSKLRVCANKPISDQQLQLVGASGSDSLRWWRWLILRIDTEWLPISEKYPVSQRWRKLLCWGQEVGGQGGQTGWRPRGSNRNSVCRAASLNARQPPSLRHILYTRGAPNKAAAWCKRRVAASFVRLHLLSWRLWRLWAVKLPENVEQLLSKVLWRICLKYKSERVNVDLVLIKGMLFSLLIDCLASSFTKHRAKNAAFRSCCFFCFFLLLDN